MLTYYTDQGQPTYLEADVDTVFSAGDWIPDFDTAVGQTFPAGTIPRDPTALGGSRSPVTVHISYEQSASSATQTAGGGLSLFPGDPSSMSLPGTVIGDVAPPTTPPTPTPTPFPSGYQCIGDTCPTGSTATPVFLSVDEVDLPAQTIRSIETGGSASTATVAQLESAGTDYPSWVESDAAPLVGKGASATATAEAAVIASLAKAWTLGTTNPYDEAAAIESHLRSGAFAYTLTPPRTPKGQWPIVYFLELQPPGVLPVLRQRDGRDAALAWHPDRAAERLRTRDVQRPVHRRPPADLPGDQHRRPRLGGGVLPRLRLGPLRAHPRVQLRRLPADPARRRDVGPESRWPSPSHHAATPSPSARPSTIPTSGAGKGTGLAQWHMGLAAGLVVVAVLLLAFFRWWRRPRSLAGVWRRLALAGRLAGMERDVSETRGAFVGRLARALGGGGPPLLEAELGTVAALSGKAEFSPQGLEDPDHRLWRDTWASLAPAITRLWRRRLLRRRPAV